MKTLRALAALSAPAVLAVALAAPAQAAVPSNDIVKTGTCQSGGVDFEARAEWRYLYEVGGVTKARIDRVEWSIQDGAVQGVDPQYNQDRDTTEYVIKSYSGRDRIQTLRDEDADVYYANDGDNGELWFGRNPANPEVKTGSRVVFWVGVAEDGEPKCAMVFPVPADLGPKVAE